MSTREYSRSFHEKVIYLCCIMAIFRIILVHCRWNNVISRPKFGSVYDIARKGSGTWLTCNAWAWARAWLYKRITASRTFCKINSINILRLLSSCFHLGSLILLLSRKNSNIRPTRKKSFISGTLFFTIFDYLQRFILYCYVHTSG